MIRKFRKKPIVVEAIQLTHQSIKDVYELVYNTRVDLTNPTQAIKWDEYCEIVSVRGMIIPTLEDGKRKEAKHIASIEDWIIKGIKGEFYPCKPDVFMATYELVDEHNS